MNMLKAVFFCLLFVLLFFSSTDSLLADEVDDLLDKCAVAPDPEPSVMVYDYELSPETLMPGDVGVLTITLKNMQDNPIEKGVNIKDEIVENYTIKEETTKEIERTNNGTIWEHTIEEKIEPVKRTIDIDTETRFTMDAYIKEAYIAENDFKVYNGYVSAGVIGPNEKVDLAFKIQAPVEEGIYMLKFIADIEDMDGKSSKGIRYFIPVIVEGTLNILPLEVSENEVRLEVINEGLSDVNSVYVLAMDSDVSGMECQPEKVYIGRMKSGDSATAVFTVNNAEEAENNANIDTVLKFKAVYKNGINKHESKPVYVRMPCSAEEDKGKSQLEEQSETSFRVLTASQTSASSSSLIAASKLSGFGVVFAFAGLLVPGIVYLFLSKRKGKRKREDE